MSSRISIFLKWQTLRHSQNKRKIKLHLIWIKFIYLTQFYICLNSRFSLLGFIFRFRFYLFQGLSLSRQRMSASCFWGHCGCRFQHRWDWHMLNNDHTRRRYSRIFIDICCKNNTEMLILIIVYNIYVLQIISYMADISYILDWIYLYLDYFVVFIKIWILLWI